MKYDDLRSQIKTGDFGLCHGTQAMSRAIEFFTGDESHTFKFLWIGSGLWAAEEWEGVGFQLIPASLKLSYYWEMDPPGMVNLGIAPDIVRNNPQPGVDLISTYRVDKNLQPYGGARTFLDIMESEMGIHHDPMVIQAVCSTFCQQFDIKCGYKYDTLFSPSDFRKKGVVKEVITIDP